jgi:fucose 4-O-acetylase-like acetyltransferase
MSLPTPTLQRERLAEFDYLRGMAIAMIVLGHSIFLAQPVFPALLENLLRGGTGLF